jgi:hypothetical protein
MPEKETLLRLRDSISVSRDNDHNFFLLFVPEIKVYDDFENIIIRESKNYLKRWPSHFWTYKTNWSEILDEFKFAPDIWD